MDRLLFAIESFKNVQELIRFIDQKAGAVLVIYGFILTVFVDFAKKLQFVNPFELGGFFSVFHSIVTLLLGIFLAGMLLYKIYILVAKILRPRLAGNYDPGKMSVYYFEHIAQNKAVYMETFHHTQDEKLVDEVLEQVFEVSKIMTQKSERLCHVMTSLFLTIVSLLVFILLVELF